MDKKEIVSLDEIKILVNEFYTKVRKDELLKDIFNERIQDNWQEHLEKMYRFWQTILLDNHTYSGSPFSPHATMPIELVHFERWQKLFNETLNENFTGEKAEEAKRRAEMMATMFRHKIEYYKNNTPNPIT
ncbi:MAG: group III truncated hemoglobin [Flavobacteriales bacterium]|nr:group III truncated hemoglobin [Flavobacteriales bacterium]